MEDIDSISDVIKNIKFENIKYIKDSGHDHIHTLMPFESNKYCYALQANENKKVKNLVHSLFCSLDTADNFNVEGFIEMIDSDYEDGDYSVREEYLISDFITSIVTGAAKEFSKVIRNNPELNKKNQIVYITMGRLPATFQSVAILIKNGFFYETICLFRVILEQISYSYTCCQSSDDKVDKLKPESTIKEFKKFFENAGRLNGYFSSFIHHNKKMWHEFIDEENFIVPRSGIRSKENVIFMVFLAEVYIAVLSEAYKQYHNNRELDESFMMTIQTNLDLIGKAKDHLKLDSV